MSTGETATSNYNQKLTEHRFVVQIDHDSSVFDSKYSVGLPVLSDVQKSLQMLVGELKQLKNLAVNILQSQSLAFAGVVGLDIFFAHHPHLLP